MGTSRGNRHGTEHTGIHWIQTFLVIFLRGEGGPGTGDKGPRTAGISRGKRHDIEYIRLHWIQTFRVNFFTGGTGDRGQGDQDGGQWEQVEVRDTTSNTLDSIQYTPLGLIF